MNVVSSEVINNFSAYWRGIACLFQKPVVKKNHMTKLYFVSVMLSPLTYFALVPPEVSGVGGSVSRLLQLIIIAYLFLRVSIVKNGDSFTLNKTSKVLFVLLIVYMGVGVLLGVFSGSYYIPDHVSHLYVHSKTYISGLINSPYVRVGVDVLIIMFNYWYFVILMPYFMRGRRDMDYFFNLVKNIALLFVVVGFIDYLTYSVFGFNLLTRHAYDSVYVGDRFHSFAGEPRHAVPYIVMLVFLYFLWSFVYCNKVRFIYLIVFILAAVLTKSTSGVVGAMIGVVFVVLFSREGGNKFSLSMLLFFLILMVFVFTEKINMYYSGFLELEWGSGLESAPRILHGQMRDIFPLMKILEDVYNLNLVPVLFGNGALSATFLNNIYYQSDTFSLLSPSSQIVRVLYEQGLIGFVILFMLFYLPFYRSSLVLGNGLQSSYLMVIAFYMAQRSVVVFIALGVVVAVVRIINLSIEESYLMQKETGG